MAYNGYLLAFDGDILPFEYIKADSYKVEPNKRQDLDSYQDQLGYLQRNALDHTATVAEWQSPPMHYDKFKLMMNFFTSRYSVSKERKASVTYYDFESDSYKTGAFYMPDYAIQVYHAGQHDFIVQPITFKVIEY